MPLFQLNSPCHFMQIHIVDLSFRLEKNRFVTIVFFNHLHLGPFFNRLLTISHNRRFSHGNRLLCALSLQFDSSHKIKALVNQIFVRALQLIWLRKNKG